MEFCQICRTRLIATQIDVFSCPKCGYARKQEPRKTYSISRKNGKDGVIVVEGQEALLHALPTTRQTCPKCDNRKAYFRMAEIGDEESIIEIQVFRCSSCGYTWREKG